MSSALDWPNLPILLSSSLCPSVLPSLSHILSPSLCIWWLIFQPLYLGITDKHYSLFSPTSRLFMQHISRFCYFFLFLSLQAATSSVFLKPKPQPNIFIYSNMFCSQINSVVNIHELANWVFYAKRLCIILQVTSDSTDVEFILCYLCSSLNIIQTKFLSFISYFPIVCNMRKSFAVTVGKLHICEINSLMAFASGSRYIRRYNAITIHDYKIKW